MQFRTWTCNLSIIVFSKIKQLRPSKHFKLKFIKRLIMLKNVSKMKVLFLLAIWFSLCRRQMDQKKQLLTLWNKYTSKILRKNLKKMKKVIRKKKILMKWRIRWIKIIFLSSLRKIRKLQKCLELILQRNFLLYLELLDN